MQKKRLGIMFFLLLLGLAACTSIFTAAQSGSQEEIYLPLVTSTSLENGEIW